MADSTTPILQLNWSQAQKEVTVNNLFDAASSAMQYGRDATTTAGLAWGYMGGRWGGMAFASGTHTLTASATNYITVTRATGVPAASTSATAWNDQTTYARCYKVFTGASTITSYEDHRSGPGGVHGATNTATFTGGTISTALNEAPTVTVASAATTDIAGAAANSVIISGTTTITGLGTIAAGALRHVTFSGALVLTHSATALILPGAANITTAANDCAEFLSLGSGNWRCTVYTRAAAIAAPVSLSATNVWTKNQSVAPATLTSGASIALDASLSSNFKLTLGVNAALSNPTNLTDGMVLNVRIKQDATGGRTLSYGTMYKWPGGVAPVLSTAANAVDFLSCYYDATDGVLSCNLLKGFA